MIDLAPATNVLQNLVAAIDDDQLGLPTICEKSSIEDLLDHVDGFSMAFTAAANKTCLPGEQTPTADASHLGADWRQRIPSRLADLAEAWRPEGAWTGLTEAGGQALPGEIVGIVALNEVIVHGWDIAVASGRPFHADPQLVEAALTFVQPIAQANPGGTPGLFGPAVPVASDAPALDRLLGLTGRDPQWERPLTS
jgi:uncharacterized protein (TIGR03086 family)